MPEFLRAASVDHSQQAFCEDPHKALRLLAPAGCGKTASLLWRCLAQTVDSPIGINNNGRCLLFTFTRAARDEIQRRLFSDPHLIPLRPLVDVWTLNSWGFRRLRPKIANLRVLTSAADRYFCLMNVVQEAWIHRPILKTVLSDPRRRAKAARSVMDWVDMLKALGFRHDAHADHASFLSHASWLQQRGMAPHIEALRRVLRDLGVLPEKESGRDWLDELWEQFFLFWLDAVPKIRSAALLTLEDQKYWALLDLDGPVTNPGWGDEAPTYSHILVDEFQDINPLDLFLLRAISRHQGVPITVIGDDDQAIFEWRGATPEFILAPDREFECEYHTHVLSTNYRSPQNIVKLGQQLIEHNRRRVPKRVQAYSSEEAHVEVVPIRSIHHATHWVLTECLPESQSHSVALIGRKRSQIIPFQIEFARRDVSFLAAEDLHVLLSEAFEQLKDIVALRAQVHAPARFGPDPVEGILKIADHVKRFPLSKSDRGALRNHLVSMRPTTMSETVEGLYTYRGPLKGENADGSRSAEFYRAVRALLAAESVSDTITTVSAKFEGLQKDYGKSIDDIFFTDPPFLHLAEYASSYGRDFAAFYADIDKAAATLARTAPEAYEEAASETRGSVGGAIHLMTALRAKGKEFDTVVVLDCNEGIWPNPFARTDWDLEAERRLFYVAVTRPRRRLSLLVNGTLLGRATTPTRYLSEMGLTLPQPCSGEPERCAS